MESDFDDDADFIDAYFEIPDSDSSGKYWLKHVHMHVIIMIR